MDIQDVKEFDPTIHTAEYVVVEHDESFAQIRDKIEGALARTPNVILIIPRGATAFHTTQDFLALGKLQWRREVRVAVATPDPTIAGLARVLGFHIVEPPADHPALAGDPGLENGNGTEDDENNIEKPTSPLPLGSLPGMPEWVIAPSVPTSTFTPRVSTSGNLTTSTWLTMPGEGMNGQQAAFEAPKAVTRAGQPPPRKKPRLTGQLLPTQIPDLAVDPTLEPGDGNPQPEAQEKARLAVLEGKAYKSGRGWRYGGSLKPGRLGRVLVSLSIVVVLLLAAASGYAYVYLPEGVVSVVPQSKTISGLPVRIAVTTGEPNPQGEPEGQPAPEQPESGPEIIVAKSLPAGIIEKPLLEEGTAPATGIRQIPRGRGAGTMNFVNQTTQPQLVPEGAAFEGPNGVMVYTTRAGTVQPTNFAALQFGTLDLPVVASVEGPDGNIEAGEITGTYKGVLTYANYAMQGGSIETVKVVTQEDIDKLKADLTARVESGVYGAVLSGQLSGQQLITNTIRLVGLHDEVDRTAGEDGDSVTAKVSGIATAYTFDEAAMNDQIRQEVYDYVQSNEPKDFGPVTDLDSIAFTVPEIQPSGGEQGVIEYGVTASARVKYTLTQYVERQIRDLVKGKNVQDVSKLITNSPLGSYVAPRDAQARVLWFNLDKLPDDISRIVIQQPGGSANNTAPSSQPGANTRGDQR